MARQDRTNPGKHKHNYQVVRTEKRNGVTYRFLECIAPGKCNKPDKMEIDRSGK